MHDTAICLYIPQKGDMPVEVRQRLLHGSRRHTPARPDAARPGRGFSRRRAGANRLGSTAWLRHPGGVRTWQPLSADWASWRETAPP